MGLYISHNFIYYIIYATISCLIENFEIVVECIL